MSSNNVIQFPGGQKPTTSTPSSSPTTPTRKMATNKSFLSVLILGLCVFAFNFKFSGPQSSRLISKDEGRSLASVAPLKSQENLFSEQKLARQLASTTISAPFDEGFGRSPSSDDEVRHGVLSSRGYIFKRDISNGYLISIQLQADEEKPAYLLHPEEFISDYGSWFNKDFAGLLPLEKSEEIKGDRRINHYLLLTHSGKKYEITVERDLFQRLTSVFQTEVANNSFQ